MPIFKLEMTVETVVEADSMEDAIDYAMSNQREVMDECEPEVRLTMEVTSLRGLPAGWDGDCFPYGEAPSVDRHRLRDLLPA